jgi:hypothetical protein
MKDHIVVAVLFVCVAFMLVGFGLGAIAESRTTTDCESRENALRDRAMSEREDHANTMSRSIELTNSMSTALKLCAERCGR